MVQLRAYETSDIGSLVALANNKNVSRYLVYTFPYPYTAQDAQWWVAIGAKENGAITKAIECNGALVGSVGLQPQTAWRDHVAEIGYWIGEPFWGKGYATAALRQMTETAFESLGFRRLIAPVLAPNIRSMRVLEKCGYECEGILKIEVRKDGMFHDIHHYARNCV
jgi:[ribosomal protein S5]-alanine N-acetyltransferase